MQRIKDIKLKYKILMVLILSGITPILVLGTSSTLKSRQMLRNAAVEKLEAVRDIKKHEVDLYFKNREKQIKILSETLQSYFMNAEQQLEIAQKNKKAAVEQMFNQYWKDIKLQQIRSLCVNGIPHYKMALKGYETETYKKYFNIIKEYVKDSGYYNYFVIDTEGTVVFTPIKEADFNTNLVSGPFKDSGLARVFKKALKTKESSISDFQPYEPNNGEQAAFIAAPIVENGITKGVVALQINLSSIHKVVADRTGMGKSGESYLAGMVGQNISLRSNLQTMGNGKFVTGHEAKTPYLDEVLKKGKSGKGIFSDSSGNLTMVIYDKLAIKGLNWAIITKKDVEETLNPKTGNGSDYFSDYIKQNNYYDLFLISNHGFIFYTVAKEPDYHTNILNGEFSSSGLGRLMTNIQSSKNYEIVDFEPYGPSNGDPAAFLGIPIIVDKQMKMTLALQIDVNDLNKIMLQKTGMGKTGETYLVGPDYRMRSVSSNDPENRNVLNSFKGNIKNNGVKSNSVIKGIAGETGCGFIKNYNGKNVLSAYAPVKSGKLVWALVAEQESAESFQAVTEVIINTLVIGISGLVLIFLISIWFARLITKPILQGVEFAEKIASGDLTERIKNNQKDEIGDLSKALNKMAENLSKMINKLIKDVMEIGNSSGILRSISDDMGEKTKNTNAKAQEIDRETGAISSMMDTIAASMEQASANINTIASSVEEMNVTVKEISENTSSTTQMSADAASKANKVTDIVKNLGEAANEIGNVTSTISDISDQTNLLALNATIEAARAGEAGKGFAVVAAEIKDLADQTATATSEISGKIEGIQSSTSESVAEVIEIARLIQEINEFVSGIAVAIEEQTSTTNEIADNVNQASIGVGEISENVAGAARSTSNVSNEMEYIAQSGTELEKTGVDIQANAEKLNRLSQELKEMVKGFKI